eukprot:TRINITY_DN5249_c0_g1_i1.p1 TRINITY_DN5249_c0_g1~~TRINITY_DN5249_c0_g1_i1.p1  ORF type:complete len:279 (-),score=53.23 TRINITY_DN5249_c0_g1_i1:342-1178(-)
MAAEEPPTKMPEACEASSFSLTAQLASGEALASIDASETTGIASVKKDLVAHLPVGTEVLSLLHNDESLEDGKTLGEYGITGNTALTSVIATVPTLHLSKPCSSTELAGESYRKPGRRAFWCAGGCDKEPVVLSGVHFQSMETASDTAKAVAAAMDEAFSPHGALCNVHVCLSSEGGDAGEVIVISNPGTDTKAACLKAFAIREVHAAEADVKENNWSDYLQCGFNRDQEDDDDEEDSSKRGFVAMTKVMSERLTKGFTFTFSEEVRFCTEDMPVMVL